mgnify:CR=1 FL=1
MQPASFDPQKGDQSHSTSAFVRNNGWVLDFYMDTRIHKNRRMALFNLRFQGFTKRFCMTHPIPKEIWAGEVLVGGCGSVGSAVLGGIVEVRLTVGTKGKPIK